MNGFILDFAGLADFEIEAGSPGVWPSWADFRFVRAVDDVRPMLTASDRFQRLVDWQRIEAIVVRWGDPRINDILEMWREPWDKEVQAAASEESQPRRDLHQQADYGMHGKRLCIVLPGEIRETHIIPKSLGILDPDSDDDEMLSDVFDPMIYHRGQAKVFDWDWPPHAVQREIDILAPVGWLIYVETERYFLQFHIGMPFAQPAEGYEILLP